MNIIRPVSPKSETVARLRLHGSTLQVEFPEKRDDFRTLVKAMDCQWDQPYWQREIGDLAGNPTDRLIEAGHKLLTAGFIVAVESEELRQATTTGQFAPEIRRWVLVVKSGEHVNWFALKWSRQDDLYNKAMTLTGARYSSPYVLVPPEHYDQVQDFAEVHKMELSTAALTLVNKVKLLMSLAVVFSPSAYADGPADGQIELKEAVEYAIDPDLADEPL